MSATKSPIDASKIVSDLELKFSSLKDDIQYLREKVLLLNECLEDKDKQLKEKEIELQLIKLSAKKKSNSFLVRANEFVDRVTKKFERNDLRHGKSNRR